MHVSNAAGEAGAVALKAEQWKRSKYTLQSSHHFVPFALETSGVASYWAKLYWTSLESLGSAFTRPQENQQQGVSLAKALHCRPEGECGSSAEDHRDRPQPKRSLLGITTSLHVQVCWIPYLCVIVCNIYDLYLTYKCLILFFLFVIISNIFIL